ncbi:ATPase [Palleronia sediminis]|uniref:ATPase n=1 Tax=Palleronia sediminis TaxID=2547833 RepID=A0A4R6A4N8_9RHOB|nr:ATP12 family protein [Palleronia sediminis]TDL77672.1 ATPase [Palleronia sediminis]
MTEWAVKRFWSAAEIAAEAPDRHAVLLDGKPVHSPAGARLTLPTVALARAVADEWDAQSERIDPAAMPLTRTANSAIDTVAEHRAAVEAQLAEYARTDLLCYRADRPLGLVIRQAELWDPWLDWAARTHGARLSVTQGVMPVAQHEADIARLAQAMEGMNHFELAGFHELVTLSGSFVLALATAAGELSHDAAWDLSRLDEIWQTEQWGRDDEAEELAARKAASFATAWRFHALSNEA